MTKEELHDIYQEATLRIAEKIADGSLTFDADCKALNYIKLSCLNNYIRGIQLAKSKRNLEAAYYQEVIANSDEYYYDTEEFEERYKKMVEHIQANYPPIFEGIFKLSVIGKPVATKKGVTRKSYTAAEIANLYGKRKGEIAYKLKLLKKDLAATFAQNRNQN